MDPRSPCAVGCVFGVDSLLMAPCIVAGRVRGDARVRRYPPVLRAFLVAQPSSRIRAPRLAGTESEAARVSQQQ